MGASNGRKPLDARTARRHARASGLEERAVAVLDPLSDDPRLAAVGPEPSLWADGSILTIAVRRSGEAPLLVGIAHEALRPVGRDLWGLRLQVRRLERARLWYWIGDRTSGEPIGTGIWSGPSARATQAMRAEVGRLEPVVLGSGEIAEAHPVRFWARPDPQAVLVCADGEGLDAWASVVAGAEERVALVGIANGGITHRLGEEYVYDRHSDRRARAYLYDVDPPYFARHMRYVTETVLPWAEATLGPLPKFVFGVSNGAAWAAQAAARHPERFAGALIFSMGAEPRRIPGSGLPPHALVAGQLEPGFHRVTAQYALRLRDRGVRVRLRRPVRGHDHDMWTDELVPALRWILHKTVSSESGDSQ